MSIRKAVGWLFDVGDGREVAALRAADSRQRRQDARPGEAVEVHLYGYAEAIRVLYQTVALEESPPKPPRRRGRRLWVARYVDSLTCSMPDLAAIKA